MPRPLYPLRPLRPPALPRACLFVGDTILAVDDDEVHNEVELLEALDERPSGVPVRLIASSTRLPTA